MKRRSCRHYYSFGLVILAVACIVLWVCYFILPYEKIASLCGNIASGVVASLIIIVFSNRKDRSRKKIDCYLETILKFRTDVQEAKKIGSKLLSDIGDHFSEDNFNEIADNYLPRIQVIHSYANSYNELYKRIVCDDDKFIEKMKNLMRYVIHMSYDRKKGEYIINALQDMQEELYDILFNIAEEKEKLEADRKVLENKMI